MSFSYDFKDKLFFLLVKWSKNQKYPIRKLEILTWDGAAKFTRQKRKKWNEKELKTEEKVCVRRGGGVSPKCLFCSLCLYCVPFALKVALTTKFNIFLIVNLIKGLKKKKNI